MANFPDYLEAKLLKVLFRTASAYKPAAIVTN